MAVFRFIALAAASMALVAAADEKPVATDANTCIDKMNVARKEVGFADLVPQAGHPNISTTEETPDEEGKIKLTTLCKILQGDTVADTDFDSSYKAGGVIGYHKQDGEGKDCEAAVNYWKDGYRKFGDEIPPKPTYTSDSVKLGAAPYDTPQASGFVALYNSSDSAKAQCVFLTCPEKNNNTRSSGGVGTTYPEAKAVVCITNPNPFAEGNAPFTAEQWAKITDVFSPNSAAVAAPTFVALAAAAVGLAFL